MEKIENFNVYLNGEVPQKPIEIIFREGKAPEPLRTIDPQKISISGDIDTVLSYVRDRYHTREEGDDNGSNIVPIVVYCDDPKRSYIELREKPNSPNGTIIRGELKENPDLKEFHFNQAGVFDNQRFIAVIRENAHCFKSLDDAKQLVKSLQNFQARFTTEVDNLDDRQGNTENRIKTVIDSTKTGIPQELHFNMPFFNGGEKKAFTVEVEIDVKMNNGKPEAKFGFFSMDMVQAARDEAEVIINNQIEALQPYFTCIRSFS